MKIRRDDNVIVISGKDKGKSGKVLRAIPKEDRVIVAGVNIKKIHQKPNKNNQKGQIIEQASPIHVSNVRLTERSAKKESKTKASK